jgi:hypothetical protein
MVERLTAAEAATQIIGLINSRPATPWPHEIETIIAQVAPASGAASALPDHVVAYRSLAQQYYQHSRDVLGPLRNDAPDHDPEYQRSTELSRLTEVDGDIVLETPAETWADLVGLASIIAHEEGHDLDAIGDVRLDMDDNDPGPVAAERLALAVLRLHAGTVPQLVPVDIELMRLISAWRRQRDIVDRTIYETDGRDLSFEDYKPYEATISNANSAAFDLSQQIWERAKAETWGGGPVSPLTLAVLAEIAFHYENCATTALEGDGDGRVDEKAFAELMVGVLAFARSAGVGSDLLPMEGRFLPPAFLKGVATMAKRRALPLRNAQAASRKIAHKRARKSARRRQKVAELVRPPEDMFPEILELPFCKYVGRPPGEDQCDWWSVPLDPKDSLDAEMLGRHYALLTARFMHTDERDRPSILLKIIGSMIERGNFWGHGRHGKYDRSQSGS